MLRGLCPQGFPMVRGGWVVSNTFEIMEFSVLIELEIENV